MFFPSETESGLNTAKLREAIKGLKGGVQMIAEDGNYHQTNVFGIKVCTHVAVGRDARFIPEEKIDEMREDGYAVYPLAEPFLCFEIAGILDSEKQ